MTHKTVFEMHWGTSGLMLNIKQWQLEETVKKKRKKKNYARRANHTVIAKINDNDSEAASKSNNI